MSPYYLKTPPYKLQDKYNTSSYLNMCIRSSPCNHKIVQIFKTVLFEAISLCHQWNKITFKIFVSFILFSKNIKILSPLFNLRSKLL